MMYLNSLKVSSLICLVCEILFNRIHSTQRKVTTRYGFAKKIDKDEQYVGRLIRKEPKITAAVYK